MKKLLNFSLILLSLLAVCYLFFSPEAAEASAVVMAYGGIGILPTPQQKLAYIAEKLGYTAVDDMQASQRTLYDALPYGQNTILNFFDQVGQRGFPFTNLTDNKLAKGEAIVVQRISFGILIRNTTAELGIVDTFPFSSNAIGLVTKQFKGLYASQFSLKIGSSEVIKKMSLLEAYGPFNKGSKFSNIALSTATAPAQSEKELSHDVIYLDSFPGITENNEFVVQLQTPAQPALTLNANTAAFIFCKLEGIGCVFSPTTKY